MSLMASLVTTSRMQQCFNVLIDIYHEFLLLFYCCVLLEIKLTTTTVPVNVDNVGYVDMHHITKHHMPSLPSWGAPCYWQPVVQCVYNMVEFANKNDRYCCFSVHSLGKALFWFRKWFVSYLATSNYPMQYTISVSQYINRTTKNQRVIQTFSFRKIIHNLIVCVVFTTWSRDSSIWFE